MLVGYPKIACEHVSMEGKMVRKVGLRLQEETEISSRRIPQGFRNGAN